MTTVTAMLGTLKISARIESAERIELFLNDAPHGLFYMGEREELLADACGPYWATDTLECLLVEDPAFLKAFCDFERQIAATL